MIIRCWGARGGIPVSGSRYTRFGGDTTCMEIRSDNGEVIIVDSGTGVRRLGDHLIEEGITSCDQVYTHFHWDHLMGLPFFRFPIRATVRVHGNPVPTSSIRESLSQVMHPPYFPIPFEQLFSGMEFFEQGDDYHLGGVHVTTVPLSHPGGGLGYRFSQGGKRFVFLTDNELSHVHPGGLDLDGYARFAAGADLLVHDTEYLPAEYEKRVGWGHSHWRDAVDLAEAAGVKALGLFHHNAWRVDSQVEEIVLLCQQELRRRGCDAECFAMASDLVLKL